MEPITTRCCVVGGGPAGMMLGFLLARAGIDVTVLEKHADFFRDFRGDTIHPSTLELMHELGLLDEFLKRPHQELGQAGVQVGPFAVTIGDFSHLPTRCKFIAFMPQWDFLNFLAESARRFSAFHLRMNIEATDIVEESGCVCGVRANTPEGPLEIRANLVIATDGRRSILRDKAALPVRNLGAPMDVLWMRLSKLPGDPPQSLGRVGAGQMLVMLDRGDYWQCAYLIPKESFTDVREQGLPAFYQAIIRIAPFFRDRVEELKTWDDIKLLSVAVDRLERWFRPGLLCVGDAAHAMSPIGGVGINLAVQDAVATANILAVPLRQGAVPLHLLEAVQQRRMFPTRATQAIQVFIQNRAVSPLLSGKAAIRSLPLALKMLQQWPFLCRIPARLIGMGFRPEHVRSPAA